MTEEKVWIILAAVLGFFVLALTLTLVLYCWKRSKRRIRGFSLRAVTPLDDAEFESWRRPSEYTKRTEKYVMRPAQPTVVRGPKTPTMLEKEIDYYNQPPTPPASTPLYSPSPINPVRKPEQVRRKSSVSIADRPPTPYSPASVTGEFPRRDSQASRKSQSSAKYFHYPSMSETSEFAFNFGVGPDSPPQRAAVRVSNQSQRPLYRYGDSL